jgi:hypothetical protein
VTPEEHRSLAEQILSNPLFNSTLDDMERSAIETLIFAKENTSEAQLRVQAIRAFRADLKAILDTRPRKGAPA